MVPSKPDVQLEKEARELFNMLIKKGYSKEDALKEVYGLIGIKLWLE